MSATVTSFPVGGNGLLDFSTLGVNVDVVIPVFNNPILLAKCVGALERQSVPHTLTMVDDASTDPQMSKFYEQLRGRPRTTALKNTQNFGFAVTCNKGANNGTRKYILLLNTDVEMTEGCLDAMVKRMESDPKIAIVGPLLLFPEDSRDPQRPAGKVQSCGFAFNVGRLPYHRFISWSPANPRVQEPRDDLQGITGACMLVRRSFWDSVHGFFSEYGSTYEDTELCIRAKSQLFKVAYEPKAVAYHTVGMSAQQNGGFPLERNARLFVQRCAKYVQYDEYRVL